MGRVLPAVAVAAFLGGAATVAVTAPHRADGPVVRPPCMYRAAGVLPGRTCTPGALNPAVRQGTIRQTICTPGWAASVRPPTSVTTPMKYRSLVAYGLPPSAAASDEYDHLVPIELGGALADARNLWPQPHHLQVGGGPDLGSYTKDALENRLHRLVCAVPPAMTLAHARHLMRTDWRLAAG